MVVLLLAALVLCAAAAEPNPPKWPSNVYIFDPSRSSENQGVIDNVFNEMGGHVPPFHGQFSDSRYAFVFLPGYHDVHVNIGFYTSVIGAGASPKDTTLLGFQCDNGDFDFTGGALSNFWRSIENVQVNTKTIWAVSQAAPMRRVVVNADMDIYQYNSGCCAGYASGGYMGDCTVTGKITSGSQQQWITRNSQVNWEGGVWNMVFVGCSGNVPGTSCGAPRPYTTVPSAPVIAEKPYIAYANGKYTLRVPRVETDKVGTTSNYDNVDVYDFSQVYVATQSDSAATINAKLASGLHVVLTPGQYQLTESIVVNRNNAVLLGIGFPTLISAAGNAVVTVGAVEGVRVAGLLLQAGPKPTSVLLQWGKKGYYSKAPGILSDIFARVGGPNNQFQQQVYADVMVQISSSNVVVDNTWFWRADHGNGGLVTQSMNPCKTGIVVDGDDVIVYGLASEHTLEDLVVWNGNNGRVYFYQSEFPYDVTQANYGDKGYVAYRVAPNVQQHQGYGIGAYTYFRDASVFVDTAISTPTGAGISFTNSLGVFLNGAGGIHHVVNNMGNGVNGTADNYHQSWLCKF